MRTCSRCKVEKGDEDFPFRNKRSGILRGVCKRCNNTGSTEHYQRYKQYYKDKAKKRLAIIREEYRNRIFEYLAAHPCVDCGEGDPIVLEFDHTRGKKVTTISTMIRHAYGWEAIQQEIQKCDVRCANCHRRRTYERNGSYRLRSVG